MKKLAPLFLLAFLMTLVLVPFSTGCGEIRLTETEVTAVMVTETVQTTATQTVTTTVTRQPFQLPTTAVEPAAFLVKDIQFWPEDVIVPGEAYEVSVTVVNTGGVEGSYDVDLYIEGVGEFTKSVTVAAGDSERVAFMLYDAPEEGIYSLKIGGLSTELYTG